MLAATILAYLETIWGEWAFVVFNTTPKSTSQAAKLL
jgi:hypothetical protein